MKKNKKLIIFFFIIAVIIIGAIVIVFRIYNDSNKLNILEKQWINNNSKIVQNIGVKNNSNVFGKDGEGVFYDFIEDFSTEYNLTINPSTYTTNTPSEDIYFKVTSEIDDKEDLVIYKDHYVVISKKNISISNINTLSNVKIGILSSHLPIISEYLNNTNNLTFTQYDTSEKLITEFDKQENIKYMIVPLNEYLDEILKEDNYINLHLSDIPVYYSLHLSGDNKELKSILTKYYNIWMEKNFEERYNSENFNFFTETLEISEEQKDKLHNKNYKYGLVINNPYEAYLSGEYGGIIGNYINHFQSFSKIDIEYNKFKDSKSLFKAADKKEIDLYFDIYNHSNDYADITTLLNIKYYVIAPDSLDLSLNSLKGLKNQEVYVLKDSMLHKYLESLNYLNIKTYDTKELKGIAKKEKIIIIDQNNYDYLNDNIIKNYTVRYSEVTENSYIFKSNASDVFNKLFVNYIKTLDPASMTNLGIYSNRILVHDSTITGTIARYILAIIFAAFIVGFVIYKSSKKVRIVKKIKKEDKMRFIDQLTSLKNRNYLNENISSWNKNTIYPQTLLVIDLNNIQYINDTFGYEQGDKQIQAAANVLIKLQLDNSDIMRMDGTEFLVYLVGYKEKQVASFMRKINKELKKLPYDYGALMAYSIINDDIKLIEDAINEATQEIKEKKVKREESEIDEEKI